MISSGQMPLGASAAATAGGRSIVYLAAPYSDSDSSVRQQRYDMATAAAAHLASQGHIVFSPLTMTHPIDILLAGDGETLGSDYWTTFDEAFMEFCGELTILTIDGWETSKGVARELAFFAERARPISFINPITLPSMTKSLAANEPRRS